jgi:hypothetical protein
MAYNVHDRVLKFEITADEGDNTLAITVVEFFRTGHDYEGDTNAYTVPFSGGAAAAEAVVVLGSVIPPPTHIAFEATFQA